jgi:hypothetical protein
MTDETPKEKSSIPEDAAPSENIASGLCLIDYHKEAITVSERVGLGDNDAVIALCRKFEVIVSSTPRAVTAADLAFLALKQGALSPQEVGFLAALGIKCLFE